MTSALDSSDLNPAERERYARHLILPEVGLAGQKRLKGASVLCIGTGGLGSPLLLYLAAAGIGRLGIVDGDHVDVSNLQRQVIHSSDWIGQSKAQSAAARIQGLNPHCHLEVHDHMLTIDNALDLVGSYDVICDGTDNFPSRYLINDACVLRGKPLIYGSVQRFDGQVSVFNRTPDSPNYRDLLPEPPPHGAVPSCSDAGVIGVLPGLVGLLQATEVIKLITDIGDCLDGRLLVVDALSMRFRELKLQKDPDRPAIKNLIDYGLFCRPEPPLMDSITVAELKSLLDSDASDVVLVDVRNPAEAEVAVIAGSHLIPLATIQSGEAVEQVRELTRGKRLFVHCKMGGRSARAAEALAEHGLSAINVAGGIDAWAEQVDPSMARY
ncbi:molybdopterin-synthase adenylyltransferase MoeB [Synechococcus sp. MIT S1220]|uniref:molybdopterin-synthase adenylyltransferase MoeB n=1 Tax=Synechococcus sp. MIT S1220 TaxID=3082549 RepID=UPI0039AF7CD9